MVDEAVVVVSAVVLSEVVGMVDEAVLWFLLLYFLKL